MGPADVLDRALLHGCVLSVMPSRAWRHQSSEYRFVMLCALPASLVPQHSTSSSVTEDGEVLHTNFVKLLLF